MKSIVFLFAAGFLLAPQASQAQTKDSKKPVITLVAPAESDLLQTGKAIHFDMDLDDDVALKYYKVEIHRNDDGHVHRPGDQTRHQKIFDQTWDVSGNRHMQVHHHGITIPADAVQGTCHFVIYCVDTSGNESSVVRNVMISTDRGTLYSH